jgi:hypothetical protein
VSSLLLDDGAFVAVDRGDRAMVARLRVAERTGIDLRSNGAVVAQVWRDPGGRQAVLARLLQAVDVKPVDRDLGQRAGVLVGRASKGDAIDATLVALASAGDRVVTSDPNDIAALVEASQRAVGVICC